MEYRNYCRRATDRLPILRLFILALIITITAAALGFTFAARAAESFVVPICSAKCRGLRRALVETRPVLGGISHSYYKDLVAYEREIRTALDRVDVEFQMLFGGDTNTRYKDGDYADVRFAIKKCLGSVSIAAMKTRAAASGGGSAIAPAASWAEVSADTRAAVKMIDAYTSCVKAVRAR